MLQQLGVVLRMRSIAFAAAGMVGALAATTVVLGYNHVHPGGTAATAFLPSATSAAVATASASSTAIVPTETPVVYQCDVGGTTPLHFTVDTPTPGQRCDAVQPDVDAMIRAGMTESAGNGIPLLGPCGFRGYPDLRPECVQTPEPTATASLPAIQTPRPAAAKTATPTRPALFAETPTPYVPPSPPRASTPACFRPGTKPFPDTPDPISPPRSHRPTITLSQTVGRPGDVVSVYGYDFPPGVTVVFYESGELLAGANGGIAGVTTDTGGNFSYTSSVPLGVCPGVYVVQAVAIDSGWMASASFTVEP